MSPKDDEFIEFYCKSCLKYYGSPQECLEKFKHINEVMDHYKRERKNCFDCKNCFDNGEALHFMRCRVYGICVDCDPLSCKGKHYKRRKT